MYCPECPILPNKHIYGSSCFIIEVRSATRVNISDVIKAFRRKGLRSYAVVWQTPRNTIQCMIKVHIIQIHYQNVRLHNELNSTFCGASKARHHIGITVRRAFVRPSVTLCFLLAQHAFNRTLVHHGIEDRGFTCKFRNAQISLAIIYAWTPWWTTQNLIHVHLCLYTRKIYTYASIYTLSKIIHFS